MNFNERMLPTSPQYRFSEDGYYVWCGTMLEYHGAAYMLYSRWKHELGFRAWVTDSEICLAKADSPLGEFSYVKTVFPCICSEKGEREVFHNPTVIRWHDRFYLYFTHNTGAGDWWTHRNRQRVCVAYADDPEGEWTRLPEPVLEVSEDGIDSLLTSNPAALVAEDDTILMVYKAVSKDGKMPVGGRVICGAAKAETPLGPFVKAGKPIMVNPENPWSVEDPFIWMEDGKYHALVKDFQGYFTKTGRRSVALFTSEDGFDWQPDAYPLAFFPELDFGTHIKPVRLLERPQLLLSNGKPVLLLCACMEEKESDPTYNIRIPLRV